MHQDPYVTCDRADDEEAKTIYAHFGLAFYTSNVLEHSMVNLLATIRLFPKFRGRVDLSSWPEDVDRFYDKSFSKTFGKIKSILEDCAEIDALSERISEVLSAANKERNFLAHHFWREHSEHWFSANGRTEMVSRLEEMREAFKIADAEVERILSMLLPKYGITQEEREAELVRMILEQQIRGPSQ